MTKRKCIRMLTEEKIEFFKCFETNKEITVNRVTDIFK